MEMTRLGGSAVGRLACVTALLLLSLACGMAVPSKNEGPYDLVLRGGWIIDGSGNPRYRGDVALRDDRIAAVGFLDGATARDTVDVSGLVVAPGFIDMMGQSETNVLIDNRVLSKITQGITTEVTGEGGSVAPLTDELAAPDSDAMKRCHSRGDWGDLSGYFAELERHGSSLNIATFVGATQVRVAVVGNENRAPSAAELRHMTAIVDTLMEQGALGVWTALEYAPASYTKTDELIALARAAHRHGGIYASHMRDEGQHIDDALNEVFRIAREAQIPAEVSHLKLSGRRSWGQMPRVLAKIDSARAAGLDVTADQYPYIRAATSLDASSGSPERRRFPPRCRISSFPAVAAGARCRACSRRSTQRAPRGSTSPPISTRTSAPRRRSTRPFRPGPRAAAGIRC